jgi:hypothetical protein
LLGLKNVPFVDVARCQWLNDIDDLENNKQVIIEGCLIIKKLYGEGKYVEKARSIAIFKVK